jgi:hypothetical protein
MEAAEKASWELETTGNASWDLGNRSSKKSFLGPGKRKQQKKLPGIWEMEAAEKASWNLENGSS